MNIIAKGGYCMVDMSGIKLQTASAQTSVGIYNKIVEAYNSAKPVILCGLTDNSLDSTMRERAVTPVHAHIITGVNAVDGVISYEVRFGQFTMTVHSSSPNSITVRNDVTTSFDNLYTEISDLDSRVTALEAGGGE